MDKLFKCTIYENWMASLEYAYLSITTPKGTVLRFDKWPPARLKNKWNENETVAKLIWRIYGASSVGWIELTKDEVLLLKDYSNLQDVDLIKKPTFNKTRKIPRGNIRKGICSCGSKLNTKDHGKWIGYSCPKCGQGGSYNKK